MCRRAVPSDPGTGAPRAHGGGRMSAASDLTPSRDSDAPGALASLPEGQGTPGGKRAWRAQGGKFSPRWVFGEEGQASGL